jgi:ribonucleoside-diphosphate reductase beta chain
MRQFITSRPEREADRFVVSLYHKSKRNFWNPQDLDFSQDKRDWQSLMTEEQDTLRHLSALFVGGEEAVALDLAPFLLHVARQGRYDDSLYVATWTFEEAKHAEFFDRHNLEVMNSGDLSHYHGESYQRIFYHALPAAMNALATNDSPQTELLALTTYNMIVEGILAETGYKAYREALESRDLMPGLRQGLAHVQADEGRHIAYGLHTLRSLLTRHPELRPLFDDRMNDLIPDAMGVVQEIFNAHLPMPFGLQLETFVDYALRQLEHRVEALNRGMEAMSFEP